MAISVRFGADIAVWPRQWGTRSVSSPTSSGSGRGRRRRPRGGWGNCASRLDAGGAGPVGRNRVGVLHKVTPRRGRLGRFLERMVVNRVLTRGVEDQEWVVEGIEWIRWPIRLRRGRWVSNRWRRRAADVA